MHYLHIETWCTVRTSLNCLTPKDRTGRMYPTVRTYQSRLRNIPEERGFHLNSGRLKCRVSIWTLLWLRRGRSCDYVSAQIVYWLGSLITVKEQAAINGTMGTCSRYCSFCPWERRLCSANVHYSWYKIVRQALQRVKWKQIRWNRRWIEICHTTELNSQTA